MKELLSPAGNIKAFYSAISNGANAIYLGLDKFSARAYAENFTLDNLKEHVDYAHLRNVKVFVTINTIIYDDELNEAYKTIDRLAEIGVDAIIVQDFAIFNYIVSHYDTIKAHASTQMGVDDVESAKLIKELGGTRIVLARETPLETIKKIKEETGMEVEAFIHGALCVAYSGNCLMSSMIGERSGNRGRCAGCCRKPYTLVNLDTKETINKSYLLSMKDLNVSNYIKNMDFIDSFKIEGRMKDEGYVARVTSLYRNIIDGKRINFFDFDKIFNRTYTKGFINNESNGEVVNYNKPNNNGYLIGEVINQKGNKVWIRLEKSLSKGDQIVIESQSIFKEISIFVSRMFDANFQVVDVNRKTAIIYCDQWVKIGAKVYKVLEKEFNDESMLMAKKENYSPLPIDFNFRAIIGNRLSLDIVYESIKETVDINYIVQQATTSPTTRENVIAQLSKCNDTPYAPNNINISMDDDAFIPLKFINEIRRQAIEKLNAARLSLHVEKKIDSTIVPKKYKSHEPELAVQVVNEEQYEAAIELGIKHIYFDNYIPRNNAKYIKTNKEVLVGGLGGISFYKGNSHIVSDYSLNIVNHESVAILSSLGVDRITLSQEISKDKIDSLINSYVEEYNTHPNLELIVYGRIKLMHTKYCVLKRLGMCGECKKHNFVLKDDYATYPLLFNGDCTTTILGDKPLNLLDDINDIKGINVFRLYFSIESKEEVKERR
ncbi:MAG: U32 family peptidase [Bacilli bacterium]|nr:U32 family peptidase [Bacilli bacterium]